VNLASSIFLHPKSGTGTVRGRNESLELIPCAISNSQKDVMMVDDDCSKSFENSSQPSYLSLSLQTGVEKVELLLLEMNVEFNNNPLSPSLSSK
jgi:hypothetical protein